MIPRSDLRTITVIYASSFLTDGVIGSKVNEQGTACFPPCSAANANAHASASAHGPHQAQPMPSCGAGTAQDGNAVAMFHSPPKHGGGVCVVRGRDRMFGCEQATGLAPASVGRHRSGHGEGLSSASMSMEASRSRVLKATMEGRRIRKKNRRLSVDVRRAAAAQ